MASRSYRKLKLNSVDEFLCRNGFGIRMILEKNAQIEQPYRKIRVSTKQTDNKQSE